MTSFARFTRATTAADDAFRKWADRALRAINEANDATVRRWVREQGVDPDDPDAVRLLIERTCAYLRCLPDGSVEVRTPADDDEAPTSAW